MAKGFQCKQFFIAHEKCAMKVSTDSLILGSWADLGSAQRILDIGCGSGVLSLMARQRLPAEGRVVAIDINEDAILQTNENIQASPWAQSIIVRQCDLACASFKERFDGIICNPPYFKDTNVGSASHLLQSASRQQARQQESLPPGQLFSDAARLSVFDATLNCLYPTSQRNAIVTQAKKSNWNLLRALTIYNHAGASSHVTAFTFTRRANDRPQDQSLVIRDIDNQYSQQFRTLCRDFYLAF